MKPQLHISGLNQLSRCGVQFENRHVKKITAPPSPTLLVGTAVHEAVALDLVTKQYSGELAEEEKVLETARDWVDQLWDEGVKLSPDERWEGEARIRGKSIDKAVDLVRIHHRQVAPDIEPVNVERDFVLEIDGLDFEIAGKIDVQERGRVRDTKTSAKTPHRMIAEDSTQLTCYALAVAKLDGEAPEELVLDYLVSLKREDKVVTLTTKRTEADFDTFLRRAHRAWEVIQAGAFMPAREDDWWCGTAYCPYHEGCAFVRHPVSVSVPGVE